MPSIAKPLLQLITFSLVENWSVQYLKWANFSYNKNFELIEIGDFLTRNKTGIDIEDMTEYKRITIKINNGGVFLRDTEFWKNIGTKRQFLVKKWQFLLSKIDARNGAFWVVPDEIDGAIITGNFWTFDVDYAKVNPHFLSLLVTTPEFLFFSENASNGTTNRHYLQEESFLKVKIPLPPLEIQDRIVRSYNKNLAEAEDLEKKAAELEKGIEDYLMEELGIEVRSNKRTTNALLFVDFKKISRWSLNAILERNETVSSKYGSKRMWDITTSKSGGTPSKANSWYWKNWTIPWVSPKDMKVDNLSTAEDYITESAVQESSAPLIGKRNILMVVRSGILQHTVPIVVNEVPVSINQDLRAFSITDEWTNFNYLVTYLRHFQSDLLKVVKSSTTVESIDLDRLMNVTIPVPPLDIQEAIVAHIDEMRDGIRELKRVAEELRARAKQEFEAEIFS